MNQPALDIKAIMNRLPHRYPFLMIDRVFRYGGDEVRALKNVTLNEGYFSGHFPGQPVMPGVMIAECMAQSAAFFGYGEDERDTINETHSIRAMLTSVSLKLRQPVVPGDQLFIHTKAVKRLGKVICATASALVDERQVASAQFTLALL